MDQRRLGMAIQRNHQSLIIETGPGRKVGFPGGQAIIRDERDMPALLRRDDLIIHIDEWVDFLPKWLNQCLEREHGTKPPRAQLELPAGYKIGRDDTGYVLIRPDDGEAPQTARRGRPPKTTSDDLLATLRDEGVAAPAGA